jgi:LysM repeat protein
MWAYWPQEPAPKPRRSLWRQLLLLGLGGMIALGLALGLAAVLGLAWFLRSDKIIPGVYIDGVAVGGRSTAEAITLLQQQWQQRQIKLEAGDQSQVVLPEALGMSLDVAATVDLAQQQGRSLPALRAWINGQRRIDLDPIRRFDPATAYQNLQALIPQFERPAKDAEMRLVNGRVEAVPAVVGQTLDVAATMTRLLENPGQVMSEGRLELTLKPVQAERVDVSGPVAQANQLLAQSISVRAYDAVHDKVVEWSIGPEEWANWLSLSIKADDPTQLDWRLDGDKARALLVQKIDTLGPTHYVELDPALTAITAALESQSWPVRLTIYHHGQQHTVQPGETLSSIGYDYGIPYPWIEQINPGLGNGLTPGQEISLPSLDLLVPLPAVEGKRIVLSLSEQKMWAYENGAVKWEWPVSTGIASSPTAPGIFQVQTHEPNAYASNWNLWMPNFVGIYRPSPASDFMNGFHGFPTRNGSSLLWTDDLGHPVTYGCILISSENAVALYDWAEAGVVVEIRK